MIQTGPYRVTALETGRFALDGGAMFGSVPKTLWSRTNPADELNRIDMRLRALLLRKDADAAGPARNILIDCGMGDKWSEKFIEMYRLDQRTCSLTQGLAQAGLKPADITDVILTHLHFDHAGGMTRRADPSDPGSELVPTFPNATVYLQRRNLELALKPSERERASYQRENFAIYLDGASSGRKLTLLDTSVEEQILPGIRVQVSNGHTLGLQVVRIGNLIYSADLVPTSSHVRLPYIAGYDSYPLQVLEEKRALLHRAADEGSVLVYEHCPTMEASTITRNEKGDLALGKPILLAGAPGSP